MRSKVHHQIEILRQTGLNLFASSPLEDLPRDLLDSVQESVGEKALLRYRSIVLVGNGGPELWRQLSQPVDENTHPFDRFTEIKIADFIQATDPGQETLTLYPHAATNPPLQRFSRFFGWSRPSPLGIDIHHRYGLWFAYRAAFLTSLPLPRVSDPPMRDICGGCMTRNCQKACPAGAVGIRQADFKLEVCAEFRLGVQSVCAGRCLARLACPHGQEHRYPDEQIEYHMRRKVHLRKLAELQRKTRGD